MRYPAITRPVFRRGGMVRPLQYKPKWASAPPPQEIKSWDWQEHAASFIEGIDTVAGIGATNAFTTGMTCLNCGIQQGATFYQRIGTKAVIKSISLKAYVQAAANAGLRQMGRSIIVYDRQPNGAYPNIGDILSINDQGIPNVGDMMTGLNLQNRSRFSILCDKLYALNNYGTAEAAVPIQEFITGRWETEFGTSTGLIGDVKTGAILWILFLNDHNANGALIMSFVSRVRYYD